MTNLDFATKDVVEVTCPICRALASASSGWQPIKLNCRRCGERSYPREFCLTMADRPLPKQHAACLAGYMRSHPEYVPTFPEVHSFARDLANQVTEGQKTFALLLRLADLHGLKSFWLNLRDENVAADLIGAASLLDVGELRRKLEECINGVLEGAMTSTMTFRGRIPEEIWTEYLERQGSRGDGADRLGASSH